jgi:asparagine synthase (glutamine-hydrolysing)
MCGIAGIAGYHVTRSQEDGVRPMLVSLARRGPDAEGVWSARGAVFGHRRLAIFDLSDDGRQPMVTADGQVGVVFNGAIYNFRALRADLERAGCAFRSRTDTEVLLHGYRQWGIDGLIARLRGMFAFGLWDEPRQTLYLVRDRLGVKPLVYRQLDGRVAFASTARALKAAGLAGDVDPQGVAEFLEYGYVTDDRSIYSGVRKVQAGEYLTWSGGELTRQQYWTVAQPATDRGPSFADAVDEIERLFLDAVRLRLDADVPVGALLSGGIDSSLVCWAVTEAGADITAFTVGTPGDPADEADDATATARMLGIRHEVIPVHPDQAPSMSDLASAYGEPFACASALGMMAVSRAVRASATVLLTGDGGDDVFLGYPEHLYFWRAQQLAQAIPSPVARGWYRVRAAVGPLPGMRRPVHFLDYATGGMGAVMHARDGFPFFERHGLLGERLQGISLADREVPWAPHAGRQVLADFLEYEHRRRFVGEYMTKVDGATMYHALEARSPFLDQEIWAFAARLPYRTRLRGGRLKAILREIARRRLGSRVSRGRKRGFTVPVQRWIVGKWRDQVAGAFQDALLVRDGWIRREALTREVQRAVATGHVTHHLWYCYVLESWLRYEQPAGNRVFAGLCA